eukprot:65690-Prymnesium_polylepis.2
MEVIVRNRLSFEFTSSRRRFRPTATASARARFDICTRRPLASSRPLRLCVANLKNDRVWTCALALNTRTHNA